jgi:serine/threonine protein kinase
MSGKFETLEKIGKTPFGIRYRGYDVELHTEVAILELADQYRNNKDYAADIWNTVSKISNLKHDYLVQVLGVDKPQGWIITEMRGISLADTVAKQALPQNVVRTVIRDVLDVISFFEKRNMVHGDIRPEMLLLPYISENKTLEQLRAKLGFSLGVFLCGEVLQAGRDFKYVAPEMIMPQLGKIGTPTDFYALAFTALELLVGPKFDSFFLQDTLSSQTTAWSMIHTSDEFQFPPLREMVPNLADDLFNVLNAALKRNVENRPQTSGEVLAMLDNTKAEAIPVAIIKSIAVETEFIPTKHQERQTIKRESTITLQQQPYKQTQKTTQKSTSQPTKQSAGIKYWNKEKVKKWIKEKANDPVYYWTFIVVVVAIFGMIALTLKPLINPEKKISEKNNQSITEKLEKERLEKERLEKEKLEKEKLEKEKLEKERLEKERLEKERLEKERLEKERLEKERLEKEKLEKEKLEKERLEILEKFIYIPYKNIGKIGAESIPKTWEELEKSQEEFYLSGNEKIEDNDITSLQGLQKLVALNLGVSVKLTDQGLEYLKNQIQLRELELNSGNLTDGGLTALSGLTLLQRLSLNGCKQIGDNGIKHLAGLTSLTYFNLPGSKITDQSLEILGKINSLQELLLWKSEALTDDGLTHLESLQNLELLNIRDCPKLTEESVTKLKGKLPKCKIIFRNGDN